MQNVLIRGRGFKKNNLFTRGSPLDVDDAINSFLSLKHILIKRGIQINTADLSNGQPDLVIDFNVHSRPFLNKVPHIVVLYEPPVVYPKNTKLSPFYCAVASWLDKHHQKELGLYPHYPYRFPIRVPARLSENCNFDDWKTRKLLVMIAANKTPATSKYDNQELYSTRLLWLKRWLAHNHKQLSLYGPGWSHPTVFGLPMKHIFHKLAQKLDIKTNQFSAVYKGVCEKKIDVLIEYKFNICTENMNGINGLVTEKIFDSIIAGCIPIYEGASDIFEYVPKGLFINLADFKSAEELENYLVDFDKADFNRWQKLRRQFIQSEKFDRHQPHVIAECLANFITKGLKDFA